MKRIWELLLEDEPGAAGGEDGAPPAEPQASLAPEPTAEQQELTALKAENARLKAEKEQPQPAAQPQVNSATLDNYTEDQWAQIETKTGKDRATITREFKDWEITNRQNDIIAKTNVTEAISEELEKNPKILKLRGAIKEYLSDIPTAIKTDPAKLKREMEKAIIYARGKHMTSEPTPPNNNKPKPNADPGPGGGSDDTNDDPEYKEGEIKNDTYVSTSGSRIKTGKIDKGLWKKVQHPTRDANSVRIPSDFDEKPRFK